MAGKKSRLTKKALHGLKLGEHFLRGETIWKVVLVNSQTEVTVQEAKWYVYVGWGISALAGAAWRKVKAFWDSEVKQISA